MPDQVLSDYLSIIQRHFPKVKKEELLPLPRGDWHEVFLVRNNVFRFPRSEKTTKKDIVEEQFLKQFGKISPIPVPEIQGYVDSVTGTPYQIYQYIPGEPLTKERIEQLSEESLQSAAHDLGEFLTALHFFPVEDAKKLGIESVSSAKEYGNYFKNALKIDKPVLAPLLSPEEWEWIEENILIYYSLTENHPFSLTIIHSDLLPKHILFDKETAKITGVIDFMFKISDPAHDFKYFDQYGDLFLKKIYENYLPVDSYFEARRKFHARDRLVGDTYYAFTTETPDAKRNQLLRELKAYIAIHPLEK